MIAVARPILRAYQEALIERVRDRIRTGLRRIVMVAVVGAGKTVMASAMIESAVARGGRVLFLAHRTELIDQACAKLASFGVAYGVILSGRPGNPLAQVQVASVQTLGRRLKRQDPAGLQIVARAWDHFDLIVADEAHHFCAGTFREVLDAYPDATVIGLTATPYRLDGAGLADVFQAIEAGPQIAELVELGFLVRPVVFAPPPPAGLAHLHLRAGEYRSDEANKVLNQTAPIGEIVETWRLRAAGRTTVGFGCTVEHAQHLAAAFTAAGIPAAAVDGATPAAERAAVLAQLARRELLAVFNCMILTEGWDLPACSAVILARPTTSRSLCKQMIGRGLRSAPGKTDCIILDHVGSVHRFGMPDEEDLYDLDGDGNRAGDRAFSCPRCAMVFEPAPVCPNCGLIIAETSNRPAEPARRELSQRQSLHLEPARTLSADERQGLYHSLLTTARDRGFNDGWAAHRYKERFGVYPPRPWFEAFERAHA